MRLPEEILQTVKRAFEPHHTYWHVARIPEAEVAPELRALWEQARRAFPTLVDRSSPGAGEQFLRFHRDMMRNYRWILQQHPTAGAAYVPWPSMPAAIRNLLGGWGLDVDDHLRRVDELITNGSADDLGNTIEPNPAGVGLHDYAHGAVAQLEEGQTPDEFSMGSPSTSHRNIVFYELHGWIDERFAEWQHAHGEVVDHSPLDPSHGGHGGHKFWSDKLDEPEIALRGAEALVSRFLAFPRGK